MKNRVIVGLFWTVVISLACFGDLSWKALRVGNCTPTVSRGELQQLLAGRVRTECEDGSVAFALGKDTTLVTSAAGELLLVTSNLLELNGMSLVASRDGNTAGSTVDDAVALLGKPDRLDVHQPDSGVDITNLFYVVPGGVVSLAFTHIGDKVAATEFRFEVDALARRPGRVGASLRRL